MSHTPLTLSPRARRITALGALVLPALAALAVLCGAVLAPAAQAATGGGFGAFPAPTPGQSHQSPYFALRLRPGQSRTVTAVAVNSSARAIPLAISAVSGLTGQTSGAV